MPIIYQRARFLTEGTLSLYPPCELRTASRRAQAQLQCVTATNQPDGQLTQKSVHPSVQKYSARAVGQISDLTPRVSPTEGRLAIVTNVRWDAVDARAETDERGLSVRRSRVVLTSSIIFRVPKMKETTAVQWFLQFAGG